MTHSPPSSEPTAHPAGMPPSRRSGRYRLFALLLIAASGCLAASAALRTTAAPKPPARYAFKPDVVLDMARRTAATAYVPRAIDPGSPLRALTYDQYRDIRFNSDAGIWRSEQVPFRIELLPAGFLFQQPVRVSIVEGGMAQEISTAPNMFAFGPHVPKALANMTLPLSGVRLRGRLNSRSVWDEFVVFQGASYFRAVARDTFYGLSARGLALRTAHPMGEEFPSFTHFWVERPAVNAVGIVVHALLDSPSTTGAYRFSIMPGAETIMDIDITLFPRVELTSVGIAPLTSMFLFDESDRTRIDDFRDEVHDSDGLQIVLASGERVWRPLKNPTQLQVSSFTSEAPRAFGLVQRSRRISDYHDFEARYEARPSAWIEPTSKWGAGAVQLIEIPSDRETNDNIVALWQPKSPIPAGKPWHTSYRLRWTKVPKLTPTLGRVVRTRSGPTFDGERRMFVVDFVGVGRNAAGVRIDAGTSTGRISNALLQPNPLTKGLRASFELDPRDANLAELRLRLLRGDRPISETWLYRWTAN